MGSGLPLSHSPDANDSMGDLTPSRLAQCQSGRVQESAREEREEGNGTPQAVGERGNDEPREVDAERQLDPGVDPAARTVLSGRERGGPLRRQRVLGRAQELRLAPGE